LRDPKANRLCGIAVWTPKGYDWVYRKFVAEPRLGYSTISAQPYENRYLRDTVPDFYELLKSSYDEKFYQQGVLGKVRQRAKWGGLPRVQSPGPRYRSRVRPEALLLWALDFNVDPMSSVIAQTVDGAVHVLDEIVLRHASTLEACEQFYSRFPDHGAV